MLIKNDNITKLLFIYTEINNKEHELTISIKKLYNFCYTI